MTATPLPPQVLTVRLFRGDSWTFPTLQFNTSGGAAENLTGWTWQAQWRATADSTTPQTLTVDSTQAATGQITVTASAAVTTAMTDTGVWDLQGTNAGVTKTWAVGVVRTYSDTTHAG